MGRDEGPTEFDFENWEVEKETPPWLRDRCVALLDHWLASVDLADPDERELADEVLDLRGRIAARRA